MHQHPRLAAACTGEHQHVARRCSDRFALGLVEIIENVRHIGDCRFIHCKIYFFCHTAPGGGCFLLLVPVRRLILQCRQQDDNAEAARNP